MTPVNARYARASPKQALTDIVTDGVFACGARRIARTLAAQNIPVFHFKWTHPLDDPRIHELGATHSVELFRALGQCRPGHGPARANGPFSRVMMDAWGRFAATGDPSSPRLPWPRYSLDNEEYLELDLNSKVRTHPASDVCEFWDNVERNDEVRELGRPTNVGVG